jgi:hypothetical protein
MARRIWSHEGAPGKEELARINAGIDQVMGAMIKHKPYEPQFVGGPPARPGTGWQDDRPLGFLKSRWRAALEDEWGPSRREKEGGWDWQHQREWLVRHGFVASGDMRRFWVVEPKPEDLADLWRMVDDAEAEAKRQDEIDRERAQRRA